MSMNEAKREKTQENSEVKYIDRDVRRNRQRQSVVRLSTEAYGKAAILMN